MPSVSRDQFNLTKCFKTSKSKEKSTSFRKNLSSCFTEFSDNTGIQGFKYLGETGRSLFEKIFWLIVLCISLYICVSLIKLTWRKWDENPVFISFSKTPKQVWEIPFPAVTICPEAKIKTKIFNFTYYYNALFKENNNLTAEEVKNYVDSQLPCTRDPVIFVNHTTDEETVRRIIQNAPTSNETIPYCSFAEFSDKCGTIFTPILTNSGVCFTFNMLDKNELFTNITYIGKDHVNNKKTLRWTVDNNYIRTKEDVYPRRAKSAINTQALKVSLNSAEEDVNLKRCTPEAGFRIMLHHPAEIPRQSTRDLQLLFENYNILVKPEITTTS
ncbi:pickpocket protein 28-like isoform X1 [Tenebrio molitor]|uniref:pickpocket protein 28-like isoform X1 n=1 Tax=Tenebrio molitor TaxID=7067 RepID=UPI0036247C86